MPDLSPPHWSSRFLAIPHAPLGRTREGADCWGLVRMVFRDVAGIDLPAYTGAYQDDAEVREIAAIVETERAAGTWVPVVGTPRELDLVVIRRGRWPSHVGLVADAGGRRMLHVVERMASRIEPWTGPVWGSRLVGIARHRDLTGRGS